MKVSLIDVDGRGFPNLALMRLSAWHKLRGDDVEWYSPLFSRPERLYMSKVFTFTPDYSDLAANAPNPVCGGTGYDSSVKLPDDVERTLPDYSLYPEFTSALGFLTRGCVRECSWCIVPRKEGKLHVVDDIERLCAGRKNVVLLDNNFLAAPAAFVTEQLEKAKRLKLRLDFNQALDARLVNEQNARELAETRWIKFIRFSCDTAAMLPHVKNAVHLLRSAGFRGEFFVYVLAQELEDAHERICRLAELDKYVTPFCQPFRDFSGKSEPPLELRRLARWCNRQEIRKSAPFDEYNSSIRK